MKDIKIQRASKGRVLNDSTIGRCEPLTYSCLQIWSGLLTIENDKIDKDSCWYGTT